MYDGVRKAPHRWGTSAATIERRTDMHEQLIKEIQKMVRDGEVPAKSVAEAVGKPYSTLMREINPYDKGAKLGVETFMAIIETTGDPTPLKLMAYELGYSSSPTSDVGLRCRGFSPYRKGQSIAVGRPLPELIPRFRRGEEALRTMGRTVVKLYRLEVWNPAVGRRT